MKKQDISVASLVDMVDREELQLPTIQRRYVWRAPRVRDLLDSLYRGYPSGSILVWETDEQVPTRGLQTHADRGPTSAPRLLLDGQQRLTSLHAVLRGKPIHVRGRKRPIEILFNLEHPEGPVEAIEVRADEDSPLDEAEDDADNDAEDEATGQDLQELLKRRTFVVASRNLQSLPNWVSVTEVFRTNDVTSILVKAGITRLDDPRAEKYRKRLSRLMDIARYPYVMHMLERDLSYEEVAEIFVRVNSLGAKLRSSDLAIAQISSRWKNLQDVLEEFQDECENHWFTLDTGLLVRAMVVFASHQCRFKSVGSISIDTLQASWEKAKDGLRFAINFLKQNAGIEDESLLSSPFLIIPIAVFSQLRPSGISGNEARELLYWLLLANARGRYSRGSSESLLNEDLALLFADNGPSKLIDRLTQQIGRVHIEAADLEGRPYRSSLFSLAFLALKRLGAKDWSTGLGISLTHQGRQHFIESHHIFPRSVLKKAGYETSEINEIANLAFISGQSNRRFGNKAPADYLPGVVSEQGQAALETQVVPLDPSVHAVENYRDFLRARREALAQVMNAHLEAVRAG